MSEITAWRAQKIILNATAAADHGGRKIAGRRHETFLQFCCVAAALAATAAVLVRAAARFPRFRSTPPIR